MVRKGKTFSFFQPQPPYYSNPPHNYYFLYFFQRPLLETLEYVNLQKTKTKKKFT